MLIFGKKYAKNLRFINKTQQTKLKNCALNNYWTKKKNHKRPGKYYSSKNLSYVINHGHLQTLSENFYCRVIQSKKLSITQVFNKGDWVYIVAQPDNRILYNY